MEAAVKRSMQMMSYLGKRAPFVQALKTPIGKELLDDIIKMMQLRLDKIIEEKANSKDLAEYRVLKELSTKWVDRINKYQEGKEKLLKEQQQ